MLTILIFLLVLGLLVFVHELGHFVVAKWSGMAVDEFGFGFPPRLVGFVKRNGRWQMIGAKTPDTNTDQGDVNPTIYSLNWIPLGGFVKIRGEDNNNNHDPKSFASKHWLKRLAVLVAGVTMNVLLAWVLITGVFLSGAQVGVDGGLPGHPTVSNPQVVLSEVAPDSVAAKAGLKPGDIISKFNNQSVTDATSLQDVVKAVPAGTYDVTWQRGGQTNTVSLELSAATDQPRLGVSLASIARVRYGLGEALLYGADGTWRQLTGILSGFGQLITGRANFSQVGGPVKIAQITGEVAAQGFVPLVQFAALLSLNLAVLNILPFPALDGGRIVFVLYEAITRRRANRSVEQFINSIGFIVLLLLMLFISVRDVWQISFVQNLFS